MSCEARTCGSGEALCANKHVFFAAVEGINQDGIEIARQFDDESSPFFQSLISDLNAAQRSTIRNFTASAIPEPSSIVVLGLGFLCTGFRRRR